MRTVCAAFVTGVAFASWGYVFSILCIVALLFLLVKYFKFESNKARIILILLCATSIAFGVYRYSLTYPTENSIGNYVGQNIILQGTVSEVNVKNGWQKLELSDIAINNTTVEDKILLTTVEFPSYGYGDRISVICNIESPTKIDDFAYDRYLESRNIWATCFSYQTWIVGKEFGSKIVLELLEIRERSIGAIDNIFGEPHASLLIGLLFGEKRFSDKWEENFLRTGTTHIVAASGYNISVVLWVAMGFFASLGIRRQKAFAFLIASIACYILLAGADAAVFRAGVMGIVLLLSKQSERKSNMISILLATVVIMLMINPRLLRDDVGFQLSMCSTIGLIYLSPIFLKRLMKIPNFFVIRDSIIATLSAMLASFPILILRFGSFSFVSLFTNVLVLPWIPLAMAGGTIATLVGLINTSFGAIILAPSWLALTVMLWIIDIFAGLNLYAQSIPWFIALIALVLWTITLLYIIKKYAIFKFTN